MYKKYSSRVIELEIAYPVSMERIGGVFDGVIGEAVNGGITI